MNFNDIIRRHQFKPTGVLHIGAAMLEEAEEYKRSGVTKVIWVEALPPDAGRMNVAAQYGHILHEGTAFSDVEGEGRLYVASNSVSSSLLKMDRHAVLYPGITMLEGKKIKTHRADKFFKESLYPEINTLVVDVQGMELPVLKGMGELLNQIDCVICEVFLKTLYEKSFLKSDVELFLRSHGFEPKEFEECAPGEWGNELFIRPRADVSVAVSRAMMVEGLMTEDELKIMAGLLPKVPRPRVLETGAWLGRSATLWHELGAVVFTIDNWSGVWATPGKSAKDWLPIFLGATDPAITPIQGDVIKHHDELLTVVEYLFSIRKADLVFIDSDHSFEGVKSDIKLAKAAIKPGGVILGHDIDFDGVKKAVDKAFGKNWTQLGDKLWRTK